MINIPRQKSPHFSPRPFWIFFIMVTLVCPGISFGATDIDFAANELNRVARSKLSHIPSEQRQTVNLLDRYQRQKQAQLRAKKQPTPPVSAVSDNTAAPDSRVDESAPLPSANQNDDFLVSYSLSHDDCTQLLANVTATKFDKGVILKAQQQLVSLGFNLEKIDDILGSETKSKLLQFCESAQFALSGELLDMLQTHITIYNAYPDWVQILASGSFASWAAMQADREDISKTRQLGKSSDVIALLDRYKKRIPVVARTDDFQVSYSLTQDDIKQLQSSNGILKLIDKLRGENYPSKKAFETALEATFKGVAEPERYVQLVLKYAEPQTGLMLTEDSFKNLKVKNLPDYIIQSIQGLKGLNYPDTQINAAVENIINTLADRVDDFKPEDIVKLAEISPSGARLTDDALKKFSDAQKKDDPLVPVIMEKLQKMKIVQYQSSKTMTSALKNVLNQVVEEIISSVPAIIEESEEITGYNLSEKSMQEINEQLKSFIVPEIYLEILSDMQDVDYPDPDMFWLATKSRISVVGTNNNLRKSIFEVIEKIGTGQMDKTLLGSLTENKTPPAIIAELATLQDRKFDGTKALEDEIRKMFIQLDEQYDPYRPLILAQARKMHPFDKTKKIQWSGESCNCVHDNLAGIVYGFYPYWMAGEKQTIDFSVMSRIGYYGLGFDDKGNILDATRWSNLDTGFIREAKSYNTKVDLVISRNNWNTWSQFSAEEKALTFENLAMNIIGLVNIPLSNFTDKAKPYVSLGISPTPIMGDGVTLYFEGYPQDKESVDAFKGFIRILGDNLKTQRQHYSVNIMFRSSEIGKGIYDYYKLKEIMDTLESGKQKLESHFLILLQEPTDKDKKLLRTNIENGMHARDRVKMLRNIIITRVFDRNSESQISDDIVYAKDNFGGIGFWTQPLSVAGNVADNGISESLNKYYLSDNVTTDLAVKSAVCRVVCPNRWVFRISWEIFILVMGACALLYFSKCEFRALMDKYFIYVIAGIVAPTLLLSMALMSCDPFLTEFSKGHGLQLLGVLSFLGYLIWNHRDKMQKANLP